MLKFLWGMLAGYIVCNIELSVFLAKKGYSSFNDVPDGPEK